MKHSVRRETAFTITLLALLVATAMLAAWRMHCTEASLAVARENQRQVTALAGEIKQMQGGDQRAALAASSDTEMSARVEKAAGIANIPLDQLVRIDPQKARRIGETNYQQQTTRVELERVTLEQLVSLLDGAVDEELNWSVPRIRLSAPRNEASATSAELWRAEVDLTQIIFTPISGAPH